MYDKVEKIINEWDPIGLIPPAPRDEYRPEIILIVAAIEGVDNDANKLAKIIYEVFNRFFGDTFKRSDNECSIIAEKILRD